MNILLVIVFHFDLLITETHLATSYGVTKTVCNGIWEHNG